MEFKYGLMILLNLIILSTMIAAAVYIFQIGNKDRSLKCGSVDLFNITDASDNHTSTKIDNLAFITLTNDGYLELTLNCLASLKRFGLDKNLICYCIGNKSYKTLKDMGYNSYLLDDNNTNFVEFRNKNWSNIVVNKFLIIHNNLKKYKYVLFTDGDIVYENGQVLYYLLEKIGKYDMIIQNDERGSINKHLCSGFMMIQSNKKTIELFDPKHTKKYKNKIGWGDQMYINEIKNKLNYLLLNPNLFPNGWFYYRYYSKIDPYIIHFNWITAKNKKIDMMKKHGKWYLKNTTI